MIKPRLFYCGEHKGTIPATTNSQTIVRLNTEGRGNARNVNVKLEGVTRVVPTAMTDRILDLLEIAAYVFAGDCGTSRGEGWSNDNTIEPWGRKLSFNIGVRDSKFWKGKNIKLLLEDALGYMTDDNYTFLFRKHEGMGGYDQLYCGVVESDWSFSNVDRVLMFSGGLDSLTGTVETAQRGESLALVTHVSMGQIHQRTTDLIAELKRRYSAPLIHVPVWVNKTKGLDREHTQRSRSFLFSALGVAIAASLNAGGVRFFENGVVSLNLPVGQEVIGARASRTTHPEVLRLLSELYSLVLDREFVVDNPYIHLTKTEVVSRLAQFGQGELIRLTSSCARLGFYKSSTHWHCGMCSQCIDRKIALVASGLEAQEEAADYHKDVFIGEREDGYEKNMAVDYARHGLELHSMTDTEIATKFNSEFCRATDPRGNSMHELSELVAMHKRHGKAVQDVLRQKMDLLFEDWQNELIPASSLLGCLHSREHRESSWRRFAQKIAHTLLASVPVAYEKDKPGNETDLQRKADAILLGDTNLEREYPFVRWGSRLTKPDWSREDLQLWIEAKYIKDRDDEARVLKDISGAITRYGDAGKRVLFVVYDPSHAIVKEEQFRAPIDKRAETMGLCIIR